MVIFPIDLKRLGARGTRSARHRPLDHQTIFVVTEPVLSPVISKPFYPAASNAAPAPDHLTPGSRMFSVACNVVIFPGRGRSLGLPIASLL
jgi:hypothetical protein